MNPSATAAEEKLFGESLSCTLAAPVSLRALVDATDAAAMAAAAPMLLQSVALIEDSQPDDKGGEEHTPADTSLQRIEAKLDLLTGLVARLLAGGNGAGLPRSLRWSPPGLCVTLPGAWHEGDAAVISLPVAAWLPQKLELPVRILATEPADNGEQQLWLAVEPLTDALDEALKRHLFRLHRRAVAEERRGH